MWFHLTNATWCPNSVSLVLCASFKMQWPWDTPDSCEYWCKTFELLLGRLSSSWFDHKQSKLSTASALCTHYCFKPSLWKKSTHAKNLSISMCHLTQLSTIGIVPFSYNGIWLRIWSAIDSKESPSLLKRSTLTSLVIGIVPFKASRMAGTAQPLHSHA